MSVFLSRSLVLNQNTPGAVSPNAPMIGWQSYVNFGTIAADFSLEAYPVSNLANESTALEWRSSSVAAQYLYTPISGEVDYVALATHNLGSAGTNISVEVQTAPGVWTRVFEPITPRDNYPIILRFEKTPGSQLRIRLVGSSIAPRVSVLFVGLSLRLPRNIYVGHTPINYARETSVTNGRNEAGDFLGRIVTRRRKGNDISLMNIPPDWFRTEFEPFMTHAEEFPFFFAWRPGDYPFEVGFAWTTGDPASSNQSPNGMMQFSMGMGAIAGRGGVPMIGKGPKWTKDNGVWVRNYD